MDITDKIRIYNEDCLEALKKMPDNFFDLAIVDPPYGININKQSQGKGGGVAKKIEYIKKDWDSASPDKLYFEELKRTSKNQIIWGANHFISKIPFDSSCWIIWDKDNGETDFADCELAWTSFKTSVRKYKWKWSGMLQQDMKNKEQRIHPTQKPVKLYEWLLDNYAKEGDRILDTHLGSGSIAIACHNRGYDLTAYEIDKDYFEATTKRIQDHIAQLTLF
jgi:site-specific DNA-methyltransferase (adenine-specific)